MLRLAYLPEDAITTSVLTRALEEHGIINLKCAAGYNPFVSLEASWDDYYSMRSRSLKKANNLAANRLKKAGDLRIEWFEPGLVSSTEAKLALDTAIGISATSWKRNMEGSLANAGPQAFIRLLSDIAVQRGWLSLWLLALDGRPLAMEYQLVFKGHVHALRADVVDDLQEVSPGTHLNRHQLQHLFGHGWRRYLMGPGDNAYKKRWTEEAEPLFRVDAYSPSARGRLAAAWELSLKPRLRALRAKVIPPEAIAQ